MASSARSLPNHYEVLGLSPTATQEEINRAFAKGMGMFGALPLAAAAQIGLAFEILRNPAKRRSYDSSLGFRPRPNLAHWPLAPVGQIDARVVAPESRGTIGEARLDRFASPLVGSESRRDPSPPHDPKLASLIASLQELAKPAVPEPAPAQPERQLVGEEAPARLNAQIQQFLAMRAAEEERSREAAPAEWKRPALTVGAIVLAAGIIGALAGVSVKADEKPEQSKPKLTMRLPAARPRPSRMAIAMADPIPTAATDKPTIKREVAATSTRRSFPKERAISSADEPLDLSQSAQGDPTTGTPDIAPTGTNPSAVDAVTTADLPLPDKVIARTIERIGFACGTVASSTAVEGAAPGTFKVTCSSGQAYQAAPVHGRYHFRRWSPPK